MDQIQPRMNQQVSCQTHEQTLVVIIGIKTLDSIDSREVGGISIEAMDGDSGRGQGIVCKNMEGEGGGKITRKKLR
jgi:hypothetical protein